MEKELLETIDVTVENICKWVNSNFEKKKLSSHEVILELEEADDSKEKKFNKKIEMINALSNILQSRAEIEKAFLIKMNKKEKNDERIKD